MVIDFIDRHWRDIGLAVSWLITALVTFYQSQKKHSLDAVSAVADAASRTSETQKELIERLDARLMRQDQKIEQLESDLQAERVSRQALGKIVDEMKTADADKTKIISDLRNENSTLLELNKQQKKLLQQRDSRIEELERKNERLEKTIASAIERIEQLEQAK